jgi:ankyrin repeat protein
MTGSISDLFTAIKKGDLISVTAILGSNSDFYAARDDHGSSILLTAAYYQQPEIVEFILQSDLPINLFEACAAGSLKNVKSILGQDPTLLNAFSPDGFQPLGLAAFFGHNEIVQFLIDFGADTDTPSNNNMSVTPLNSATAGSHLEIAHALLEHGANPNFPQADGFVPLHAAAQNGQREMVELLLKYGADPGLKNKDGKSAFDMAILSGHIGLAELLK